MEMASGEKKIENEYKALEKEVERKAEEEIKEIRAKANRLREEAEAIGEDVESSIGKSEAKASKKKG